jgi:hypothetical protein
MILAFVLLIIIIGVIVLSSIFIYNNIFHDKQIQKQRPHPYNSLKPATPDKPINVVITTKIRIGAPIKIKIRYFNNNNFSVIASPIPLTDEESETIDFISDTKATLKCKDSEGNNVLVTVASLRTEVDPHQEVGFEAVLFLDEKINPSSSTGQLMICPLEMFVYASGERAPSPQSTQFFIEVQ